MPKQAQLTFNWNASVPEREPAAPSGLTLPNPPALENPADLPRKRRSPARLPVPKPLPSAIGRGSFGEDEHGPVRPTAAEVRAITENQAARLVDLFDEMDAVELRLSQMGTRDRTAAVREKDRILCAIQSLIAMYAEDFGEPAAHRLEAYARHKQRKR